MMPIMVFELLTYGFIAGILYNKLGSIYLFHYSAPCWRDGLCTVLWSMLYLYFLMLRCSSMVAVITAIQTGIIGILIQITIVPMIVKLLKGEFINVGSNIGPR